MITPLELLCVERLPPSQLDRLAHGHKWMMIRIQFYDLNEGFRALKNALGYHLFMHDSVTASVRALNITEAEVHSNLEKYGFTIERFHGDFLARYQAIAGFLVKIEVIDYSGPWFDYSWHEMQMWPSRFRNLMYFFDDQIVRFNLGEDLPDSGLAWECLRKIEAKRCAP